MTLTLWISHIPNPGMLIEVPMFDVTLNTKLWCGEVPLDWHSDITITSTDCSCSCTKGSIVVQLTLIESATTSVLTINESATQLYINCTQPMTNTLIWLVGTNQLGQTLNSVTVNHKSNNPIGHTWSKIYNSDCIVSCLYSSLRIVLI